MTNVENPNFKFPPFYIDIDTDTIIKASTYRKAFQSWKFLGTTTRHTNIRSINLDSFHWAWKI